MIFRTAELKDIAEISEIRKRQIQDEGQTPDIDIDEDLHRYFEKYIKSGELIEWVAEEDGRICRASVEPHRPRKLPYRQRSQGHQPRPLRLHR